MMDLPIGAQVSPDDATCATLIPMPLHGAYTSLVPLLPSHAHAIFKCLGGPENAYRWTYMLNEPFLERDTSEAMITSWSKSKDPLFYCVLSGPASDPSSTPVGLISYLSIVPSHRRIEIGCVIFSEQLKRTRGATEASYLMLKRAFEDLGNRRVEWKANHLNKPSAAAAERLGFVYEGIFR
jgi:RimJ/RimL family protein N-acetyltransferase